MVEYTIQGGYMTNEEAKAIICKEYLCVDRDCDIERNCGKCDLMIPSKEPILEAYKVAIKALEQEPCDVFDEYGNYKYPSDVMLTKPNTATSIPCDDAISRQAVIEIAKSSKSNWIDNSVLFKRVNELPTVTPQSKTGHWIYKQYGSYPECGNWHCSECDKKDNNIPLYCPNCGAKMYEPQESEDK
jgi:hypothetical protein